MSKEKQKEIWVVDTRLIPRTGILPEKLKMFGTGVICHKPVFCPGGYHYSWLLYVAGTGIILVLDSKFLSSVIFHVTALMPTRDSDPGGNSKKMHIGNDFVTVVCNDSQQAAKFSRIKVIYRFLPDYKHPKRSRFRKLALGHPLLCIFFSFLFFSFWFCRIFRDIYSLLRSQFFFSSPGSV